jgi:hypothetical protein
MDVTCSWGSMVDFNRTTGRYVSENNIPSKLPFQYFLSFLTGHEKLAISKNVFNVS